MTVKYIYLFVYGQLRSVGRPTMWTDDLVKVARRRWMQAAQNRSLWCIMREAYVQQWTAIG